jgi:hypothetical protein
VTGLSEGEVSYLGLERLGDAIESLGWTDTTSERHRRPRVDGERAGLLHRGLQSRQEHATKARDQTAVEALWRSKPRNGLDHRQDRKLRRSRGLGVNRPILTQLESEQHLVLGAAPPSLAAIEVLFDPRLPHSQAHGVRASRSGVGYANAARHLHGLSVFPGRRPVLAHSENVVVLESEALDSRNVRRPRSSTSFSVTLASNT